MDKTKQSTHTKKRNDLILITALVLIVLSALLVLFLLREEGGTVRITKDGELWGEYSLSEDRTVEIVGEDGYNRLIIEDGEAYMEYASCPDGICVSHRPVKFDGESIICLPNRVVVEIYSAGENAPNIIS